MRPRLSKRAVAGAALLLALCIGGFATQYGIGVPTAAQGENIIHTVQSGETLTEIAALYGVTVENLAAFNGIPADSALVPGQQLFIPPALAVATSTPQGSTSGGVDDPAFVFEARPSEIPPTPTLAYDPGAALTMIDPAPSTQRFIVGTEPFPVRGAVVFNEKTMAFWKFEIKGSSRSFILPPDGDIYNKHPAGLDWITISTSTESVLDGTLGVIPPYPNLSAGNWEMRVAVVAEDGTFVASEEIPFRVALEQDQVVLATVNQPLEGTIVDPGAPIIGSVLLNWATGSYRVELRGGPFTNWTIIQDARNDAANPIEIRDGVLASIPADLPEGVYEGRLIVTGLNSDYIQEPVLFNFAIGTDNISNLAGISVNVGSRAITTDPYELFGSIRLPNDEGYYKVEIIDDVARFVEGQQPRFEDWTTIDEIQPQSVRNGDIATLPGVFTIGEGEFLVRVVIVNATDEVIETLIFRYTVRF